MTQADSDEMESYHSLMVDGGVGGKFPLLTQGVERNSTDYRGDPAVTFYTALVWQEQVVSILGTSEAFLSGNCLLSIIEMET